MLGQRTVLLRGQLAAKGHQYPLDLIMLTGVDALIVLPSSIEMAMLARVTAIFGASSLPKFLTYHECSFGITSTVSAFTTTTNRLASQ
jgi:hypothetical protein